MNNGSNGSNGTPNSPGDGAPPDRLDGWKEIAAYLRRAPRTVQRWEARFGLPIHRIGGEVVHAFKWELDAWAVSEAGFPARAAAGGNGYDADHQDADALENDGFDDPMSAPGLPDFLTWPARHPALQTPPQARQAGRRWGWAAAAAVVAVALGALWFGARTDVPPIHAWRANGDQLWALDEQGQELWVYRLPAQEGHAGSGDGSELPDQQQRALIQDLDGDGSRELVFVTKTTRADGNRLLVLNADGTLRFSRQRTGDVEFGGTLYHGPFAGAWVKVTTNADGSKALWYQSRHYPLFAGVIEKFDARGNLLAEYWNGGIITSLAVGIFGGRRLVFIGGAANEGNGAALAVFEEARVGGGNVGADFEHTCTSCGPVQADAILLFPRPEVGRVTEAESVVCRIESRDEAELQVDVEHYRGPIPGRDETTPANSLYFFDASLRLKHAEHYSGYRLVHDLLWRQAMLDHPYGDADRAEVVPILRWTGGAAFEPVYPADAGPAAARTPNPASAARLAPATAATPGARSR